MIAVLLGVVVVMNWMKMKLNKMKKNEVGESSFFMRRSYRIESGKKKRKRKDSSMVSELPESGQ